MAGALAFVFWGPTTLVGLLIDASGPIMLQVLVVLIGALYWERATKEGAIISMIASEVFLVLLWIKVIKMPIGGIHNGVWAMILGVVLLCDQPHDQAGGPQNPRQVLQHLQSLRNKKKG